VTLKTSTAAASALAALALTAVPTAEASIACRAPANGQFPAITRLRASHTGCATARAVSEGIQAGWQATGKLPASFDLYAGGPVFHCRYRLHQGEPNPYKTASCVSGRKLVTMILGS
jgi:hypothetical protein